MKTPYGEATKTKVLDRGITLYEIDGQQYLFFDKDRNSVVPACYRNPQGWYSPLVFNLMVMLFPKIFDSITVQKARNQYMTYYPDVYEHVMGLITSPNVYVIPTRFASEAKFRETWYHKNRHKYIEVEAWNDTYENVPAGKVLIKAALGGDTREHIRYFFVNAVQYEKTPPDCKFICIPGVHEERQLEYEE